MKKLSIYLLSLITVTACFVLPFSSYLAVGNGVIFVKNGVLTLYKGNDNEVGISEDIDNRKLGNGAFLNKENSVQGIIPHAILTYCERNHIRYTSEQTGAFIHPLNTNNVVGNAILFAALFSLYLLLIYIRFVIQRSQRGFGQINKRSLIYMLIASFFTGTHLNSSTL